MLSSAAQPLHRPRRQAAKLPPCRYAVHPRNTRQSGCSLAASSLAPSRRSVEGKADDPAWEDDPAGRPRTANALLADRARRWRAVWFSRSCVPGGPIHRVRRRRGSPRRVAGRGCSILRPAPRTSRLFRPRTARAATCFLSAPDVPRVCRDRAVSSRPSCVSHAAMRGRDEGSASANSRACGSTKSKAI